MSLSVLDAIRQLTLCAENGQISFELLDMWGKMGVFARSIVGVLGVMSAYSLGVMAERLITYSRSVKASRLYAARLGDLLPSGKYGEAIALFQSPAGFRSLAHDDVRPILDEVRAPGAVLAPEDLLKIARFSSSAEVRLKENTGNAICGRSSTVYPPFS